MYGHRTTTLVPASANAGGLGVGGTLDRYRTTTSGVTHPSSAGGGGGGWTLDRSGGSRVDRGWSPQQLEQSEEMQEMSHNCRTFLVSRLRAAERMNDRLSEDAKNTANSSRLRSIRPPGEFNVDLAIEQLRAQVASLLDADIGVIRQLLTVNEQMEELRWQRKYGGGEGGSQWTPSTLLSESCMDSVDYDPDVDPLLGTNNDPRDHRSDDVRPHVTNGCFGDDVTDDVFQSDETVAARSELRFKVTPGGLKACSADQKVNRSKIEVKGVDEINDRLKRSKVEFKVDGGGEKKSDDARVQIRFVVNAADGVKGQSDNQGHSYRQPTTDALCQQSRDSQPLNGPIRNQRIGNEASRETRSELGPQLCVMNLGQGIGSGQAGNTTPAKVRVTPFSVAAADDYNEESETIVVHL